MKKPETKAAGKTNKNKEQDCVKVQEFQIGRVKMWDNGGITFDLTINGITIYNCRVVEFEAGDFISFPSRKGNDGKYYNHVFVKLSAEDTKMILDAVEAELNK